MLTQEAVNSRTLTVVEREGRRAVECEFRRPLGVSSCGHVDKMLGWRCGMGIDECDKCFTLDPASKEAAAVREAFALRAEEAVMRIPRDRAPVRVLLTIAGKKPAKEAKEIIRSVAARAGEAGVEAAAKVNAAFEREVREVLAGLTPEQRLEAEGAAGRWGRVKHTWEQATSFAKSIASRGITQDKACDEETYRKRVLSCFGVGMDGEKLRDPCPSLIGDETEGYYCGDCGCGQKPLARLDTAKLRFPYLECPRRRDGFSNEIPHTAPVQVTVTAKKAAPKGAVVIKNCCFGIGDAVMYAWTLHSARKAGVQMFINIGDHPVIRGNSEVLDLFSVPREWWTEAEPTVMGQREGDHPSKGEIHGLGWLDAWLDGFGAKGVPHVRPPYREESEEVAQWADAQWAGRDGASRGKGRVLIAPEGMHGARIWPLSYYSELSHKLMEEGYTPIVMVKDYKAGHQFPWAMAPGSLARMAAMLRRADLFVGNDSGPAHFSTTLGVRSLVLVGPSPPQFFEHVPRDAKLMGHATKPCGGCNWKSDFGYGRWCDHQCNALMALTPEKVLQQVRKELKR